MSNVSTFTTPSRMGSTNTTAAQRTGGSSSRRVVRSALEALMETATPELPGRVDCSNSQASEGVSCESSTLKCPTNTVNAGNVVPSTSPFSVTYTTAPPGFSTQGHHLPSSTPVHATATASTSTSTRAHSSTDAPSKTLASQAKKREPSALEFLSPQGKAAKTTFASSFSVRDDPPRSSRRPSSGRHDRRAEATAAPSQGKRSAEDTPLSESTQHEKQKNKRPSARDTSLFAAPTSPSRSLYDDVEAAQQQQQQQSEKNLEDTYAKPPSPIVAAVDTSFAEDSDNDDDGHTYVEYREDKPPFNISAHRLKRYHSKPGTSDDTALVSSDEVEALITEALRRYEKERDAEEESVLQQVSEEVEAQATRYVALVEAYNDVCSDNARLQEKLSASSKTCEDLEQALQHARQAQQSLREAMKQLEVELYHARDAQEHAQEQQRVCIRNESADWEVTRRRYEKRHATLEAQLTQQRAELAEKDDNIADLTRQLEQQEKAMQELRQRSSQRETAAEDEYAGIHQRMRQLAQNMSTMETTLRERDDVISHLREQLADVTAAHRAHSDDVRQLREEKEKAEAELASARESVKKQTDDARKRMHRLTLLEQQKDALKREVSDARQTLIKSTEEQAQLLKSLEGFVEEVRRFACDAQPRTGRNSSSGRKLKSPRDSLCHAVTDRYISDDGDSHAAANTPHMDDTLVYEDDSESEHSNLSGGRRSDDSNDSDADTIASLTSMVIEGEQHGEAYDNSKEERDSEDDAHGSVASPSFMPTSPLSRRISNHPSTNTNTTAKKLKSPPAVDERVTPSVKRLSQLLHHNVARAQMMVRELRRRVTTFVEQQQRKTSPVIARLQSNSTARAASVNAARRRCATGSSSLVDGGNTSNSHNGTPYTKEHRYDVVRSLEQACRYLKSELTTIKLQLREAQSECQWRTLSMKKLEDDVQAARRELLKLEKERLNDTTEKEMAELVKQELEKQLAESQQKCTTAQTALERLTATQESTQQELEAVTSAKTSAEAALKKEEAKATQLSCKVTALTDELEVLKGKQKTALSQLQAFRAHDATQQLKEQEVSHERSSEMSGLRSAVAQLRIAEGAWEEERTRLQATVAALQNQLDSLKEDTEEKSRRCTAWEMEAALHANLETATLTAIANIVGASPFTPEVCDAYKNGSGEDVSPTDKKLFAVNEPSVEDVVVVRGRAATTVVRSRFQEQHQQSARTPKRSVFNSSSSGTKRTPSTSTRRRAPSPSQVTPVLRESKSPFQKTPAAAAGVHLAQLRQHVVTAVQRAVLELGQLRALTGRCASPSSSVAPSPSQEKQQQQSATHSSSRSVAIRGKDDASVAMRLAVSADDSIRHSGNIREHHNAPSTPFNGIEAPLLDPRHTAVPFTVSRSSPVHAPPPLSPQPSLGSGSTSRAGQRRATTADINTTTAFIASSAAPTTLDKQLRPSSSSPSPLQPPQSPQQLYGPASLPSRRPQELTSSTTHSPESEHMYNVASWTPSRGLWPSPSASPPVKETAKMWSEVRRSTSTEDGLSTYSHSATRGDVDGSGSPARPPSLRARIVAQ